MKFLKIYYPSIIWFACIVYASFMPSSGMSKKLYLFQHQDKVIHATIYGIFIWIFLHNYSQQNTITTQRKIICIIIIALMSLLIEFLQPILSDRTFDIYDFVANSVGLIFGAIAIRFLYVSKKFTLNF